MRRRYRPTTEFSTDFELDLAPLLSVMVKLVPVLLLSSAFVQFNMIETELPQVVQQALDQTKEDPEKAAQIRLDIKDNHQILIHVTKDGRTETISVGAESDHPAFETLHTQLVEIKRKHPDAFRLELAPGAQISYDEIVKVMDEARKTRDPKIRFPITNKSTQEVTSTDYMFPEVIFANTNDG